MPTPHSSAPVASRRPPAFQGASRGLARSISTILIASSVFFVPLASLRLSHAASLRQPVVSTEYKAETGRILKWADELNAKASFKYPQSAFFRDGMAY
jgi:hypothetical protein